MTNVIEIPRLHFDAILERLEWLGCLEAVGVENWEGCEKATELFNMEDSD